VNVTAEAPAGLSADFASLPSLTLDEGQLGDLELLLTGAFAPLTGFMSGADVASVAERGTLADGTPWPAPVTLDVPAEALPPDAGQVLLNDPEGTPLAVLDITERLAVGPAGDRPQGRGGRHAAGAGLVRLSGPVTGCRPPEHGPFRHLRRDPADVRADFADGPVLGYATRRPLHGRQIGTLLASSRRGCCCSRWWPAWPIWWSGRMPWCGRCAPPPGTCHLALWWFRSRSPRAARILAMKWRSGLWSPPRTGRLTCL
jgi:hypothetical protein